MPARVRVLARPGLRLGLLARAVRGRGMDCFPLGRPGCTSWHLARVAVWQAFRALGLKPGDRVLMPSYLCGSEVDPAARLGLQIALYPVGADLQPDLAALRSLAPGARALYVTHFFGFPQPLADMLPIARAHGMPLIEDCAHALHGRDGDEPLGGRGDAAIFSLRKTLPAPDGGLLLLRDPALRAPAGMPPPLRRALGGVKMLALEHLAVRAFGKRVRLGAEIAAPAPRALVADVALDPATTDLAAAPLSLAIARAEDPVRVRERRREHYLELRHRIGAPAAVRWPLGAPAPGVAPWILPAAVADPEAVRDGMIRRGVQAFRVWGESHPAADLAAFPAAAWLKRHLVGVPVHQELRPRDLPRIADAFLAALAGQPPPPPPPAAFRE